MNHITCTSSCNSRLQYLGEVEARGLRRFTQVLDTFMKTSSAWVPQAKTCLFPSAEAGLETLQQLPP